MKPDQSTTPRQQDTLAAIREYRHANGVQPTLGDIAAAMGISKTTAFEHVTALLTKGHLRRGGRHSARSLSVVGNVVKARWPKFQVVGTIARFGVPQVTNSAELKAAKGKK